MAVLKYLGSDNLYHALPIGDSVSVIQPDEYSEEEIVTGKWIDGRPIYRKVLTNIPAPQVVTIGTTVTSNVDLGFEVLEFTKCNYKFIVTGGVSTTWNDFSNFTSGNFDALFRVRPRTNGTGSNSSIDIMSGHPNWNVGTVLIIIEYTKPTDAENSFTIDMVSTSSLSTTATDAEVNSCFA